MKRERSRSRDSASSGLSSKASGESPGGNEFGDASGDPLLSPTTGKRWDFRRSGLSREQASCWAGARERAALWQDPEGPRPRFWGGLWSLSCSVARVGRPQGATPWGSPASYNQEERGAR